MKNALWYFILGLPEVNGFLIRTESGEKSIPMQISYAADLLYYAALNLSHF